MKENHFPPNITYVSLFFFQPVQVCNQNIALWKLSEWIAVRRSLCETIVHGVVERSQWEAVMFCCR
jgi:hypothetical protein